MQNTAPTLYITGSAGALGRVVAKVFMERGWNIVTPPIGLDLSRGDVQLSDLISEEYHKAHSLQTIIHCAGGIQAGKPIPETSTDTFLSMLHSNVVSLYTVLHHCIPLLSPNASICAIGAKAALHPTTNRAAYSAAKSAVVNLILSASQEGLTTSYRANCIIPNIIRTPANEAWGTPEEIKTWVTPEQIVEQMWEWAQVESTATGVVLETY